MVGVGFLRGRREERGVSCRGEKKKRNKKAERAQGANEEKRRARARERKKKTLSVRAPLYLSFLVRFLTWYPMSSSERRHILNVNDLLCDTKLRTFSSKK